MPRKTKSQKVQSKNRTADTPQKTTHTSPVKKTHTYQYVETEADKKLRLLTGQDITRTLLVTILLCAFQYIVFTQADVIRTFLK